MGSSGLKEALKKLCFSRCQTVPLKNKLYYVMSIQFMCFLLYSHAHLSLLKYLHHDSVMKLHRVHMLFSNCLFIYIYTDSFIFCVP